MNDDTKQCPYCAETIKLAAKVCRYCHMDLTTGKPAGAPQAAAGPVSPPEVQARSSVWDGVKIGVGIFIVLPILILVGFLFLGGYFAAVGNASRDTSSQTPTPFEMREADKRDFEEVRDEARVLIDSGNATEAYRRLMSVQSRLHFKPDWQSALNDLQAEASLKSR